MTVARRRTAAKDPATKATNLWHLCLKETALHSFDNVPHDYSYLLVRKLTNVHACEGIAFVEPPNKEVRKFIELPEFPSCKRCVTTATDRRWVFMIFLNRKLARQKMRPWIKKRTSKYRKNEYMRRYRTMKGAKMAFKIPIKMKRRLSLKEMQYLSDG